MRVFSSIAMIGVALFMIACSSTDDTSTATAPDRSAQIAAEDNNQSYIVEYNGKLADAQKAVAKAGGVVIVELVEVECLGVAGLTEKEATALGKMTGIVDVVPNISLQYVPDFEDFADNDGQALDYDAQPAAVPADAVFFGLQWGMAAIDAEGAWEVTTGDGVRVGILDTGGSPDHIDLDGKYDLDACKNFVTSNPFDGSSPVDPADWQDRHFHGTHVAGIVSTNNIGVAGTAPGATLVAVKVLSDYGFGSFLWIMQGILYASDPNGGNCDVINMSLGGGGTRDHSGKFLALLNKVINTANKRGCLVVCAAGNSRMDLDHSGNFITVPAQSGKCMAVSATGPTSGVNPDGMACYTNYGVSLVNVAAPGGGSRCGAGPTPPTDRVLSCFAPYVAIAIGFPFPYSAYVFASGTSMACPHTAGVAALAEAASGNSNPGWLTTKIQNSADDLGKPGVDPYYGKGRINANNAVH